MKPSVARAALESGASLINDVQANRPHPAMWETAAAFQAGYVAMHMQGHPSTMQKNPIYQDVVADVDRFFDDRLQRLHQAGVAPEQVALDVGLGFGKTLEHNLQLLASLNTFKKWKRPLLLGASRKSFIGHSTGTASPSDRLPGSLACACWARAAGVQIIRTHDVAATCQALRMTEALMAVKPHGF
jgi:dihydropteroate synthase